MKWPTWAQDWLEWGVFCRAAAALAVALVIGWGAQIDPRAVPAWAWAAGLVLLGWGLGAGLRWWWRTR